MHTHVLYSAACSLARHCVTLLILLVSFTATTATSQTNLTVQVLPPYSANLNQYLTDPGRVLVTVHNSSMNQLNVRFQAMLTGDNGVEIRTNANHKPSKPLTLQPAQSYSFSGPQLKEYFNGDGVEFIGINRDVLMRTGQLPEGNYRLCARLLDYNTGAPLSPDFPGGCSNVFLVVYVDPPIVIAPAKGDTVRQQEPQNVRFSWLPAQTPTPMPVRYQLRIVEVIPVSREPEDAMQTAPRLFFDQPVTGTDLLFGPAYPSLIPGRRYAVQLRASDPTGTVVFRNGGNSQVQDFFYQPQPTIEGENVREEIIEIIEPPTLTLDTTRTTTSSKKHCDCSAGQASISQVEVAEGMMRFAVNFTPKCSGEFGSGPEYRSCAIANQQVRWSIVEGKTVASIDGPSNNNIVAVTPLAKGTVVLHCTGTVTCNDGKKDSLLVTYEFTTQEPPPTTTQNQCGLKPTILVGPKMNGGLIKGYNGKKTVFRDEYIALGAEGKDFDIFRWECIPMSNCPDSKSEREIPLTGRVKFSWSIAAGEGAFVQLGCLPGAAADVGDHVVFQPPYVPLPKKGESESKITTILLKLTDDDDTKVKDDDVERKIVITTTRRKADPDRYTVEVKGETGVAMPLPEVSKIGSCKAVGPGWSGPSDLVKPVINRPKVADNEKMVIGEWAVLEVSDQRDPDILTVSCVSQKCASPPPYIKSFQDNVQWTWTLASGGGKLIVAPGEKFEGNRIIYEAPLKLAAGSDKIEVKIKVKAFNPDGQQLVDAVSPEGEITLYVHRAGVKLAMPKDDWLPEDGNSIELASELMHRESGKWGPALAHMCRIHFFELMDISTEKGVCVNAPVKKDADRCRDFLIKDESDHEAHNDKTTKECKTKDMFIEARTKKPLLSYTMKVHSKDYGSYGFLKSEARLSLRPGSAATGAPDYESIPVKKEDVAHPAGRKKKKEYADNRVTIPLDIDENHIADGGWRTFGAKPMADPEKDTTDEDEDPVGDESSGDGFGNYEEYRGFKVGKAAAHRRTDITNKDLFVHNEDGLTIGPFRASTKLEVHEITKEQYGDNTTRIVNFNSTGVLPQRGLHLINGGSHSGLLGIALTATDWPAPPNWVKKVIVYKDAVIKAAKRNKLSEAGKEAQVTAHELSHACNVYHHGEAKGDDFSNVSGPRSGQIDCIMRYDNHDKTKEAIGTILCTATAGTGSNTTSDRPGYGDAARGRGKCNHQPRITGRFADYPKRH